MAYYVGDIPAEDLVIEPARDQEPISLDPFTANLTETELRDPDGALVLAEFTPTFAQDLVVLEWPDSTVFDTAGIWTLRVTLVGPDARETLAPVWLVAQDDDGWHTIDTARGQWADAPSDDATLATLLLLAKQQVLDFAPQLAPDARPPLNYRAGQLGQARNAWNAGKANPATGDLGGGEFTLTIHPLDWHIQQILRPKRGVPRVG